jgi:hypothetical protein
MRRISAEYAGNVSPKLLCSGLLVALLLAACGGTSHSSSSTTTASSATTASTSSTATTTVRSKSVPTATTAKTTTATTRDATKTPVAPPAASGPRVPATYTIGAGGTLSPQVISPPAGYTVEITFIDQGSAVDHVTVNTPRPLRLVVPAGGDSSQLVSHLPKGSYSIIVNGTKRGSLVIGSAPGP